MVPYYNLLSATYKIRQAKMIKFEQSKNMEMYHNNLGDKDPRTRKFIQDGNLLKLMKCTPGLKSKS